MKCTVLLIAGLLFTTLMFNCNPFGPNNKAVTMTDADGNVYSTVRIGTQIWTVENLKTTKYTDGTSIPQVRADIAWRDLRAPGFCWYYNDSVANKKAHGALYNWYAIETGKLIPDGWHVPTDSEWNVLSTYLGGDSVAGQKLKDTSYSHWFYQSDKIPSQTGFAAFTDGYRSTYGDFADIAFDSHWWSSSKVDTTIVYIRDLSLFSTKFPRGIAYKYNGFSIRLIKDNR